MLWFLLAGLGIALLALVVTHDTGTIGGIASQDFASLATRIALLVFIGSAVIMMFRGRMGLAVRSAAIWLAIGGVLAVGYTYRMELRAVGDRVMAELVPGHAAVSGAHSVEVVRGNAGDFRVTAQVNGTRISMVVDSGASTVVLSQEDAQAIGLPTQMLDYNVAVETAGGRTSAAAVTLDQITIGNIVERAVPALVAPPKTLRVSLLGMSFLNRLESWQVRGERLEMRGYP